MGLQNRWFKREKFMQDYPSGSYELIHCGIRIVKTKDIIGLSLWPPETLVKDRKTNWLRKKVNQEGWNDPLPGDLDLLLLPTGKYTVSAGGNHRVVLADELGINEIQASVRIVMPKALINKSISNEIEEIKTRIDSLEKEAIKLNDYLHSKGIYRVKYKKEEKTLSDLWNSVEKLNEKINDLLKKAAIEKGIVSETFFIEEV